MRQAVFLFLACLVAFSLMLGFLFSGNETSQPALSRANDEDTVLEPRKEVRDITPDDVVQAPVVEEEMLVRLPAIVPPPPPVKPPEPVRWLRPVVVSAGTLKSGGRVIRLAGIRETALERVCTDKASQTWPCGRFAKSSLSRFVRARTLDCDALNPASQQVETRCRISGQDLSQWLVRYGWAEPRDGLFEDELALAQRENRGLWRITRP